MRGDPTGLASLPVSRRSSRRPAAGAERARSAALRDPRLWGSPRSRRATAAVSG